MAAVNEGLLGDTWNACTIIPHKAHETEEETLDIAWWTNAICLPIIAFLGISCNLVNVFVLTYNPSSKRIPSRKLLLTLAICDCLFLFFAVLEITPMSIRSLLSSPVINEIYTKLVLYIRTFASTFYKSSVLLVVAFNFERFMNVCYPLAVKPPGISTNKTIIFCIIFSFFFSLQWPLAYKVNDCYDHSGNHSYFVISITQIAPLQFYYKIMDYSALFLFNIVPIVALLILNIRIIWTIRNMINKDLRQQQQISPSAQSARLLNSGQNYQSNKHRNANAILFSVVGMLFICVAPQAPARLLYEYLGHYNTFAVKYTCISQLLVFLNASLNFLLYCLVSKRYRSLLKESFRMLMKSHRDLMSSSAATLQMKTRTSSLHAPSTEDHLI
uniref:G_PROTEIN_RECEP_F1_2 domain-containing protein n=1 Tax=Rhabditophanes sp. KR3021 TaxID=114890 RepID=A0AC35TSQ7_9BILA